MRNLHAGRFFFCWLTWIALQVSAQNLPWGYRKDNGPETWPGTCATGQHQSPLNILESAVEIIEADSVYFGNYGGGETAQLCNDGHTAKIKGFEDWKNRPYIVGGTLSAKYKLLQIHFHWGNNDSFGSEHKLNGVSYPVEIHFVHEKDGDKSAKLADSLAVVGVFFQITNYGTPLFQIEELISHIVTYNNTVPVSNFVPSKMLSPNLHSFYTYDGSLTTPGCDETVKWIVFPEPVSITRKQLQLLRNIQADDGKIYDKCNCRPTQKLNDRHFRLRQPSFSDRVTGFTIALVAAILVVAVFAAVSVYIYLKKRRQHAYQQLPSDEDDISSPVQQVAP